MRQLHLLQRSAQISGALSPCWKAKIIVAYGGRGGLSQATFISRSVHKPKGVESHEEDSTPGTLH
jgi:hypothetical protein